MTPAEHRDALGAFLARFDGKPVEWGQSDCSAAPARWVDEVRGVTIRLPSYSSKEEAHDLIAKAGGLDVLWAQRLGEAGICEQYGEPQFGDVAIIETRKLGLIGGIVADGQVLAIRKDNDIRPGHGWHPFGPVRRFVKVWSVFQ